LGIHRGMQRVCSGKEILKYIKNSCLPPQAQLFFAFQS